MMFWFSATSVPPDALSGGLSGPVAGALLLQVCGWDAPDPARGWDAPGPDPGPALCLLSAPILRASQHLLGGPYRTSPQLSGGPRGSGWGGGSPLMDRVRRAGRDPSACCCRSVCL